MMLNFAEFNSSNLTGKVLEQAFVRYSHNKHLKIQLGQFRPYFGIEDEIPSEFIKSVDFSNGYYLLEKTVGKVSKPELLFMVMSIKKKSFEILYRGATNGNSRGSEIDNDQSKHVYARLEKDFKDDLKLE